MEMLTLPLSLVAFAATLWVTSFFAQQLHAKKADMAGIALSWLIATIASVVMLFGITLLAIDKYLAVAAMYFLPLLSFTLVYKMVNKMNWGAAITTNIIAIAVGVIAVVVTIISSGKPLEKTLTEIATTVGLVDEVVVDNNTAVSENDVGKVEEELVDIILTDADLTPI